MRIGQVAAQTAVNVQTPRYYERRGLLPAARRQASGYREYDAAAVGRVRFIKHAQARRPPCSLTDVTWPAAG